jgi:transposase-like protein
MSTMAETTPKPRRARRQFDDDLKAQAVRLVLDEGKTVPAVARDLDLTEPAASSGGCLALFAANQARTLAHDVRRETRAIVSVAQEGRHTRVAAHPTYLHLPAYPHTVDLSWTRLDRFALNPAQPVRDRSVDWQDVDAPEDPVLLRHEEMAYVRELLESQVHAAGCLTRGGELV